MRRFLSSFVLGLVAALALAGCGGDDGDGSGGSAFNDADVTFAQSMIPHHEQAVQMSRMARARASDPEVKELARTIEAAQGPEIATMKGWLEDWGEEQPSGGSMGGMDHGSDGPGMMGKEDMGRLGRGTGPTFDRMFLIMMIDHHTGAIEMAQTEQTKGENADARALARRIEDDQTSEIRTMKGLLARQ